MYNAGASSHDIRKGILREVPLWRGCWACVGSLTWRNYLRCSGIAIQCDVLIISSSSSSYTYVTKRTQGKYSAPLYSTKEMLLYSSSYTAAAAVASSYTTLAAVTQQQQQLYNSSSSSSSFCSSNAPPAQRGTSRAGTTPRPRWRGTEKERAAARAIIWEFRI